MNFTPNKMAYYTIESMALKNNLNVWGFSDLRDIIYDALTEGESSFLDMFNVIYDDYEHTLTCCYSDVHDFMEDDVLNLNDFNTAEYEDAVKMLSDFLKRMCDAMEICLRIHEF